GHRGKLKRITKEQESGAQDLRTCEGNHQGSLHPIQVYKNKTPPVRRRIKLVTLEDNDEEKSEEKGVHNVETPIIHDVEEEEEDPKDENVQHDVEVHESDKEDSTEKKRKVREMMVSHPRKVKDFQVVMEVVHTSVEKKVTIGNTLVKKEERRDRAHTK
ncbi:hypothetical protein KI387_042005, partial [Taxus chinensis]